MPDRTERDSPRTAQSSAHTGSSSGSVDDAGGAAAHLAAGEGDAYPAGPGAESGMLQGMMTNPEVPNASMGEDDLTNAADRPMPANEAAGEIERRGIALKSDPTMDEPGGESYG